MLFVHLVLKVDEEGVSSYIPGRIICLRPRSALSLSLSSCSCFSLPKLLVSFFPHPFIFTFLSYRHNFIFSTLKFNYLASNHIFSFQEVCLLNS